MPTFETPEPIAMTIELVIGDARITVSDRTETVVSVHPANDAKKADVEAAGGTSVEYADGRLVVRAPKQWKRFTPFDNGGSIRVVVEAPTGSSVEATSALGDLHGEGELGDCRLKTAMGHIRLDHGGALQLKTSFGNVAVDGAAGDVDVHAGSGEIAIGNVHGTAVIKNANGSTRVGEVAGHVRVKAANGDIMIERALASVTAKTANGTIRVGEVVRDVAVLETAAGDLACGIAEGTAVWLDVRSQFGQVRSTLEASAGPAASDERVEVRARTSIGDIDIYRAPATTDERRAS